MPTHLIGRSVFGNPANAGRLIPLEEAHLLLNEWVPNERLRLHMKQVAAVMKAWAIEKEKGARRKNGPQMGISRSATRRRLGEISQRPLPYNN